MKDKITKLLIKISYIIFALVISIALWMYVEIAENRLQVRDIPVREILYKNQDLLSSRRLLVSSVLTRNLVLTFEGPRADISNLISGDVYVEVDLESIRDAGTVALNYSVILPDNVSESVVNISNYSSSQIFLFIDRLMSKEFPVEVNYTGGTASAEYMDEPAVFEPRTVMVSGPETVVSQIAHMYVPIVAENLSTTYTSDLRIIPFDENWDELDAGLLESETLTFSPETIRVTIPVRQLKELPVFVELSHGVTTSESNTTWFAEPSQITVAGDPDMIKDINRITLGTVDMTSFPLQTERVFPILIPDGLLNISGETEASVRVEVIGLTTEWRSVSDLQVVNVPAGYIAEIRTQSVDVRIRGAFADLASISSHNLWIVADLTDFGSPASRRIPANAYTRGTNGQVDIVSDVAIVVNLFEDVEELP